MKRNNRSSFIWFRLGLSFCRDTRRTTVVTVPCAGNQWPQNTHPTLSFCLHKQETWKKEQWIPRVRWLIPDKFVTVAVPSVSRRSCRAFWASNILDQETSVSGRRPSVAGRRTRLLEALGAATTALGRARRPARTPRRRAPRPRPPPTNTTASSTCSSMGRHPAGRAQRHTPAPPWSHTHGSYPARAPPAPAAAPPARSPSGINLVSKNLTKKNLSTWNALSSKLTRRPPMAAASRPRCICLSRRMPLLTNPWTFRAKREGWASPLLVRKKLGSAHSSKGRSSLRNKLISHPTTATIPFSGPSCVVSTIAPVDRPARPITACRRLLSASTRPLPPDETRTPARAAASCVESWTSPDWGWSPQEVNLAAGAPLQGLLVLPHWAAAKAVLAFWPETSRPQWPSPRKICSPSLPESLNGLSKLLNLPRSKNISATCPTLTKSVSFYIPGLDFSCCTWLKPASSSLLHQRIRVVNNLVQMTMNPGGQTPMSRPWET